MDNLKVLLVLMMTILSSISFLTFISAICDEGQIDINTASLEELDNLSGIGPVKAQAIIDSRPFGSVDDLVRVSGIKNATLNGIKSQGLACVADEGNTTEEEPQATKNNETQKEINITVTVTKTENATKTEDAKKIRNVINSTQDSSSLKEIQLKTINLNPQVIKTEENSQTSGKSDSTIYYLIAFAIVLALLFLTKNLIKRRKEKNELA